jgi:hypothetical protein
MSRGRKLSLTFTAYGQNFDIDVARTVLWRNSCVKIERRGAHL